jgi:hypothetical protein
MIASLPRRSALASLVACLVLSLACTNPPEKEMHLAQGAIEAARAAGAAEYATEEFRAAEAALKRSNDAVEERDYRQALNYALDASERAQSAARAAAEARAAARSDAERLLTAAEEALAGTKTSMRAAIEAKVPQAQLAGHTRAIAGAEASVDNARALIGKAEYAKARAALSDLSPRLSKLGSEIDAEAATRSAKRPARRPGR